MKGDDLMSWYKDKWVEMMANSIDHVYPGIKHKDKIKFLEKVYDRDFKDVECSIYDNYNEETWGTTLDSVMDFIDKEKPLMCESGVLFKRHDKTFNPNTLTTRGFLDKRKIIKKDQFKYDKMRDEAKNAIDIQRLSDLVMSCNLGQNREKTKANSGYGVKGMKSSFAYNHHCALSTTLKGQAEISLAYTTSEDFMGDNVKFYNMDECIKFIVNTTSEKESRKFRDSEYLSFIPTEKDVYKRLKNKFKPDAELDKELLHRMVSTLNQSELNRVYYKSNLYEFCRNDKIKQMLKTVTLLVDPDRLDTFKSESAAKYAKDIQSREFLNPNEPPKYMKKKLCNLSELIMEYVFLNKPVWDRGTRIRRDPRHTVKIIDTDSNMLYVDPWLQFIKKEVINGCIYEKNGAYSKVLKSRIINTITYFITDVINATLLKFTKDTNIPESKVQYLKMKNEFLYDTLVLTDGKKHYTGVIRQQEGVYFKKPKLDIKGMDFNKASAAKETKKFLTHLVYHDILTPDTPDITNILDKLELLEKKIRTAIVKGRKTYYSNKKIKPIDAYADPGSIGQFKAAYIWNKIYPDKEIEFPGMAAIVKMKINKPGDIAELSESDPEIFEKLCGLLEDDFINNNITSIGVPLTSDVPRWMIPYIETDEIIKDNLSLIYPILKAYGIHNVYKKKSTQFFSNIIQL
jgi:hypothetical protein